MTFGDNFSIPLSIEYNLKFRLALSFSYCLIKHQTKILVSKPTPLPYLLACENLAYNIGNDVAKKKYTQWWRCNVDAVYTLYIVYICNRYRYNFINDSYTCLSSALQHFTGMVSWQVAPNFLANWNIYVSIIIERNGLSLWLIYYTNWYFYPVGIRARTSNQASRIRAALLLTCDSRKRFDLPGSRWKNSTYISADYYAYAHRALRTYYKRMSKPCETGHRYRMLMKSILFTWFVSSRLFPAFRRIGPVISGKNKTKNEKKKGLNWKRF